MGSCWSPRLAGWHPSAAHARLAQPATQGTSVPALRRCRVDPCRPGCTFMTVDVRLSKQQVAALLGGVERTGSTAGHVGDSAATLPRSGSSSKQAGDGMPAAAEELPHSPCKASACGTGSGNVAARAALLHHLTAQLLHWRSLGDAPSASPLLAQLGSQHLAAATGGRLLRCLALPTAAAGATAPAVPQLTAVSPACVLVPQASCGEPVTVVLAGHGLWNHDGAPGLVLCRQQGELEIPGLLRLHAAAPVAPTLAGAGPSSAVARHT